MKFSSILFGWCLLELNNTSFWYITQYHPEVKSCLHSPNACLIVGEKNITAILTNMSEILTIYAMDNKSNHTTSKEITNFGILLTCVILIFISGAIRGKCNDESDALESSSVAPKWVPTNDLKLSPSMFSRDCCSEIFMMRSVPFPCISKLQEKNYNKVYK